MIYDGALYDTTNFSSDKFIEINSCNMQHSNGMAWTTIRRYGRVDYHILYIAQGSCICEYKHSEKTLQKGDFILYPPRTKQCYALPEGTDTVTMWLHFTGSCVPEVLNELKLEGGVSHAEFPNEAEFFFRSMLNMNSLDTPQSRMSAKGYLLNFLSSLSKSDFHPQTTVCFGIVRKMVEYITLNWQKNIGTSEVAHAVCLSKSRTAHLFKETVGESISHYIQKIRIAEAKKLLLNSDMNISEIGCLVGYNDPLYFSRRFKAVTGYSPKRYRSETGFQNND